MFFKTTLKESSKLLNYRQQVKKKQLIWNYFWNTQKKKFYTTKDSICYVFIFKYFLTFIKFSC